MDLKTLHEQRRANQAQAQSANQSKYQAQAAATRQALFPLIDQMVEITRQRQELLKQSHADEAPEILLSARELAEQAVRDWQSRADGFGSLPESTVSSMGQLAHDLTILVSGSFLPGNPGRYEKLSPILYDWESPGLSLAGEDQIQALQKAVLSGSPDQVRQVMRQAVEVWSQKEVSWNPPHLPPPISKRW